MAKKVLRSEASIRFEKGLDATKTKEAQKEPVISKIC